MQSEKFKSQHNETILSLQYYKLLREEKESTEESKRLYTAKEISDFDVVKKAKQSCNDPSTSRNIETSSYKNVDIGVPGMSLPDVWHSGKIVKNVDTPTTFTGHAEATAEQCQKRLAVKGL